MRLIDVSFGTKLGGAFGAVLVLLIVISISAYSAARIISRQSIQADATHTLSQVFEETSLEHMEWLQKIAAYLLSSASGGLQIETDHQKCRLGQWLFGPQRKLAVKNYPALTPLLSQIEAPHERLHASAAQVSALLAELVAYTKTHFTAEEAAMQKHGYPGLADQQREHSLLIQDVTETQKKMATGNAMISMEIMAFLKDWLVNHIQGSDKAYGAFFNSKGIT